MVPLVVGVTGHRDLVEAELPGIEARVRKFLSDLQERCPNLPLRVMTPLAEGADCLVGRVAQELGIPLTVPLPMPIELYEQDFSCAESLTEFHSLRETGECFELPLVPGSSYESILVQGPERDRQYAQVGTYLASHSHILLAIWDGQPSELMGGTAQVVQFHQYDVMRGFTAEDRRARLHFTADESDLVYHIMCSREGAAQRNPDACSAVWLTSDQVKPVTLYLPAGYVEIFRRMEEFAEDLDNHEDRIAADSWPLYQARDEDHLREGARRIDSVFRAADCLAIYYQKRVQFALLMIYSCAAAAGICFVAYADLEALDVMIFPYLGFLSLGVALAYLVSRKDWQRRYLEYRALAEGLRVQFYWSVAGVRQLSDTKFTHDTYLRSQDIELGWIRNVMRVTGARADIGGGPVPESALQWVVEEWVGDESSGQTAYFKRVSGERQRTHNLTRNIGRGAFVLAALAATLLAFWPVDFSDASRNGLIAAMGLLPLLAVIRETYAQKRADQELVRQYQFMYGIFSRAHRMLAETDDVDQQHHILRSLGSAALEENSEWLLRLRDRPLQSAGTPT
jgi:hypothetical protein